MLSDLLVKLNAADAQYVARPCELIDFGAARLRMAVRAAIQAYKKSGKMVDPALVYAAHGFQIFPLTINKTPVPPRDKDANGKKIPGTGSFKKATTDPIQIHAWWDKHEYLIGLRMGVPSGVWALDIDTSEDHADGVAEWEKIAAQHDPIVTREHRSATGGPHLIFNFHAELLNGCSSGSLPDGITVKGAESYIVVPPSRRKGRSYSVFNDIDPADQPQWLTDLILQGHSPSDAPYNGPTITADLDEIADALSFIPNDDDVDWNEWTAMGLRIYAATGGEGFELFDVWSAKSSKYGVEETLERWEGIQSSPPTRTGVGKIFKIAREHGWVRKLRELPPPADDSKPDAEVTAEAARAEIKRVVREFLDDVAVPESEMQDPWVQCYFKHHNPEWVTRAINAMTGMGKTKIVIAEVAAFMHAVGIPKTKEDPRAWPIIYAVPTHRLSEPIDKQFADHGINARIFYGRDHADPELHDPDKTEDQQIKMCLNERAVDVAKRAHADIAKTCCFLSKGKKCRFYDPGPGQCGYYRQQENAKTVQVWIVASNMLFHPHRAFGEPVAVISDESFWQRGLRGIEQVDVEVPLASLPDKPPGAEMDRDYYRALLGGMLRAQKEDGPVELLVMVPKACGQAIALEWQLHKELVKGLGLEPGMSPAKIARVCTPEKIDAIRHTRNIITLWEAVRWLWYHPKVTVCGRLLLKQKGGQRVVQWRGVADISKQATVPTLMLDATLPDRSILQVYHPHVQTVVNLKVAMPSSVRIKQVLDAPTSSNKLDPAQNEKHLQELRRYILQRWLETGRGKTLVVCQLKAERWLVRSELPPNIHVEHFNAITGVDIYRDVRLEIVAGRTAANPAAIETLTGALTGQQPEPCKGGRSGFIWYERVKREIKLRDGRVIETTADLHLDPVAEPVRWQTHEAGGIQAIGRSRPYNRTADSPLDLDLLLDTPLIPVDEVVSWGTPSLLIKTAADEGVMLTSPVDLVRLWPSLWKNTRAADRTLQGGVPSLPGFTEVAYQLSGPNMKRRTAWFDLSHIPDPHAWLARLQDPAKPL